MRRQRCQSNNIKDLLLFVNDPLLQLGRPAQGHCSLTCFFNECGGRRRGVNSPFGFDEAFYCASGLVEASPASISFVIGRPFGKSPGEVRAKNYGDDGLRRIISCCIAKDVLLIK